MTDGIIQEVFNKYIQLHDCECPDDETNQWNKLIRTKFMIIQQELIEKIKQRFPIDYDENYSMWHEAIQKILIGGNQE